MTAFSSDYFAARDRFRAAANLLGCRLESQAIESRGPTGEELTIDVARRGPERAERIIVVSSGLHGAEGRFGSAVQTAWLEACASRAMPGDSVPPSGAAIVFIHALNPWGFAHLRRTDQRNIDLNRNFLLPGEQYAGSPALYEKLDPILNPPGPTRRFDFFRARALAALARHGRAAVTEAVAQGQYGFPRGLFFGGTGESEVARLLGLALPRWLGNAERVLHLDFHTGLGAPPKCKLLADFRLSNEQRQLCRALGTAIVEPENTPSTFYRSRGGLGRWCRATFPDRQYLLLVTEFGTYPALKVLSALRGENQAHHFCQAGDARLDRAKAALCEVFCPHSDHWRNASLAHGVSLIQSAVHAISAV
jgi:hypothetical protein